MLRTSLNILLALHWGALQLGLGAAATVLSTQAGVAARFLLLHEKAMAYTLLELSKPSSG